MSKKRLSGTLIISIALHAALIFYLGSLVLDKVLPTGEVSTVQINFENPKPTQVDVVNQLPVKQPQLEPKPIIKKIVAPKNLPKDLPEKNENPPPIIEDIQSEIPIEAKAEPQPEPIAEPVVSPQPEPIVEKPAEKIEEQPAPAPIVTASETGNDSTTTGPVQSDAVLSPAAGNKKISYPYWSRLRKQEGLTVVHYTVTGEGTVSDVNVVQSSGHPFLDREVVNTVKGWKFKPLGRSGVYERPVQFSLKGDAQAAPSTLRTTN